MILFASSMLAEHINTIKQLRHKEKSYISGAEIYKKTLIAQNTHNNRCKKGVNFKLLFVII